MTEHPAGRGYRHGTVYRKDMNERMVNELNVNSVLSSVIWLSFSIKNQEHHFVSLVSEVQLGYKLMGNYSLATSTEFIMFARRTVDTVCLHRSSFNTCPRVEHRPMTQPTLRPSTRTHENKQVFTSRTT